MAKRDEKKEREFIVKQMELYQQLNDKLFVIADEMEMTMKEGVPAIMYGLAAWVTSMQFAVAKNSGKSLEEVDEMLVKSVNTLKADIIAHDVNGASIHKMPTNVLKNPETEREEDFNQS
jgi:hypothetical protein